MNRKTKVILVTSLILNLLLLGFFVGQSPRRFARSGLREQYVEQQIKDLPAASQSRLRERLKQLRTTADPLFSQLRQAQDDTVRLLGADPFDEAAFERQEAKITELRADMTKKLSQVVKDAIKDLNPEERRHFAEILRRPPPSAAQS